MNVSNTTQDAARLGVVCARRRMVPGVGSMAAMAFHEPFFFFMTLELRVECYESL